MSCIVIRSEFWGVECTLAVICKGGPSAILSGIARVYVGWPQVWACAQANAGAAAAGVAMWARLLLPLVEREPTSKNAEMAVGFLDHVFASVSNKAKREALMKRAGKVRAAVAAAHEYIRAVVNNTTV
eukprot:5505336-Pyramimonas_sp.AAC.1